jgi:hypothetical protein
MIRSFGMSACGALMLIPLLYLPSRSLLVSLYDPTVPYLELPVASEGQSGCSGPACPVVSLDHDDRWTIAGIGPVSEEQLRTTLIERRDLVHQHGYFAKVVVRIGAQKPARHISRFFQIAEACELDGVRVAVWAPDAPNPG